MCSVSPDWLAFLLHIFDKRQPAAIFSQELPTAEAAGLNAPLSPSCFPQFTSLLPPRHRRCVIYRYLCHTQKTPTASGQLPLRGPVPRPRGSSSKQARRHEGPGRGYGGKLSGSTRSPQHRSHGSHRHPLKKAAAAATWAANALWPFALPGGGKASVGQPRWDTLCPRTCRRQRGW